MEPVKATIKIKQGGRVVERQATKLRFSMYRCFVFDGGSEDLRCIELLEQHLLARGQTLALVGANAFCRYLLERAPALKAAVACVIDERAGGEFCGLPVLSPAKVPERVRTAFICETRATQAAAAARQLPTSIVAVTAEVLRDLDWRAIPERAWTPDYECLYPIDIPKIAFEPGLDLILLDCPARNLALMPNGLAYVHNALKKTNVKFQTFDLDIVAYHRYHTHRLLDAPDQILTPSGKPMAADPWLAEAYDEWQDQDVIEHFRPEIDETVRALVTASPKILGLSIQACNIRFAREIVKGVKAALPETIILVGGYSCYQSTIGRRAFPESDYMCIGEADLTIGPLVEALARGERPKDLAGVFSRHDSEGFTFKEAPMPMDLDKIEMPNYEWTDLKLYRNYNHYQLTPIIASRGCKWSRCTFCAERFFWRIRSPKNVVDEFEWLHEQGCDLFMFNESDLNGKPDVLVEICEEIARRGLKIRLTGQLRVVKTSDRKFFDALRRGGFVALRFGVDAWSANALRQQLKGYTTEMVYQNLKDCWEAGIYTEVNTVIGVPGETEKDIDESIDLMVRCKPYIGRVANINPLMLVIGSVYWEDPDRFNVKFRGDKNAIFEKYPSMIPTDLWYSEKPYIDQPVRLARFERIARALKDNGFDVGAFASRVMQDVKEGKGADHSARPDIANANQVTACDETPRSSETAPAIRVQSGTITAETANAPLFNVFRHGQTFYGLPKSEGIVIAPGAAADPQSAVRTAWETGLEKGLRLLRDAEKLSQARKRALRALQRDGAALFARKLLEKLRGLSSQPTLVVEAAADPGQPDGVVAVTRDYSQEVQLVFEGFHSYNIVVVRRDYYAIRQGYPFDKMKADAGGYEPGAVFKGERPKDVERQVLAHLGLARDSAARRPLAGV